MGVAAKLGAKLTAAVVQEQERRALGDDDVQQAVEHQTDEVVAAAHRGEELGELVYHRQAVLTLGEARVLHGV